MVEKWKDIPGLHGYQASSEGRVRSRKRNRKTRDPSGLMRPSRSPEGYDRLVFMLNEKPLCKAIHVAVCTAFHGDQPSKLHEVDHIDQDKTNNRATNLRWVTRSRHTTRHAMIRRQHALISARTIIAALNSGEDDLAQLCAAQGMETRRFRELVRTAGHLPPTDQPLPARAPRNGLTPNVVDGIRARLASGERGRAIALDLDVHESTISRIKTKSRDVQSRSGR